jgi:hypothetical protein
MTLTRKINTFGGTKINIYVGHKTIKKNPRLPIVIKEIKGRSLIGGATGVTDEGGEGKEKVEDEGGEGVVAGEEEDQGEGGEVKEEVVGEGNEEEVANEDTGQGEDEGGESEPFAEDWGKNEGEGKGIWGNKGIWSNNINPIETEESKFEEPNLKFVAASITSLQAEDDDKIDKIEILLTKNWQKLYDQLETIKPETNYDPAFKSELTQLIQEMVAVALLQTI